MRISSRGLSNLKVSPAHNLVFNLSDGLIRLDPDLVHYQEATCLALRANSPRIVK